MPGILPTLQSQVQEIRQQSLAALLAAVDSVSAPAKVSQEGGRAVIPASNPLGAAVTATAVVVEAPQSGRILIEIAGERLTLDLPPSLQRLAAAKPELFVKGAQLPVNLSANGVRIAPIALPPSEPPKAATIRNLSTNVPATQNPVEAAPALANAFPPGTIGAAITRLTGIAFPIAERAAATPTPVAPPTEHAPLPRAQLLALSGLTPELAQAIVRTAAQQAPLAPAIATLLALPTSEATAPALTVLQTLRLDGLVKPDATEIEQAIRRSGVFLESDIAKLGTLPLQGDAAAKPAAPPVDLKSVLLALKAVFEGKVLERPAPGAPDAPAPATSRTISANSTRETTSSGRESAPAQANTDLVRLVEGAIERVKLSQMASLHDHPQVQVTDDRSSGTRLALSIPVATQGMDRPQTATIGLVIEHRPQQAADEFEIEAFSGSDSEEAFPWKVRIAVDLEETGPVQAEIALRGQSIAITLWAERKAMAGMARAEIGNLHEALTKASFDVTRLEVRDGRPIGSASAAVPILDRRS